MDERIRGYFSEHPCPTVAGLALALGLRDTAQLRELAETDDGAARALLAIQAYSEEKAYGKESAGARFVLENAFGWGKAPDPKDERTQEVRIRLV